MSLVDKLNVVLVFVKNSHVIVVSIKGSEKEGERGEIKERMQRSESYESRVTKIYDL